jgi:hypothetical protein
MSAGATSPTSHDSTWKLPSPVIAVGEGKRNRAPPPVAEPVVRGGARRAVSPYTAHGPVGIATESGEGVIVPVDADFCCRSALPERALTCADVWSRPSETNRRPTHYEPTWAHSPARLTVRSIATDRRVVEDVARVPPLSRAVTAEQWPGGKTRPDTTASRGTGCLWWCPARRAPTNSPPRAAGRRSTPSTTHGPARYAPRRRPAQWPGAEDWVPRAIRLAARGVESKQVETLGRPKDLARLRSPRPSRLEPTCALTMQRSGEARRRGRGLPAGRLKNRTPPPVVELAARRGARRVSGGACGRCLNGLCRDGSTDFRVMYPLLATTCQGRPDLACGGVGASSGTGSSLSISSRQLADARGEAGHDVVLFLGLTGQRWSEFFALQVGDLTQVPGVSVERAVTTERGGGKLR